MMKNFGNHLPSPLSSLLPSPLPTLLLFSLFLQGNK